MWDGLKKPSLSKCEFDGLGIKIKQKKYLPGVIYKKKTGSSLCHKMSSHTGTPFRLGGVPHKVKNIFSFLGPTAFGA